VLLKDYSKRFFRLFKSVRLTIVVIALLIVIYFLGLVLPQKWMFGTKIEYDEWLGMSFLNRILDFIGFTNIYLSPLTIMLLGIFFLNLIVVTVNRVPIILKKTFLTGEPPSFHVSDLKKAEDVRSLSPDIEKDRIIERLTVFFSKRRWYLNKGKQRDTYLAVRNRFSPIGFLLFHLSFLFCLVGGLMITYTRFAGEIALTEEQTFEGDIRQFHRIYSEPKILKRLPALGLYLRKVHPFYKNNVPTELVAVLGVNYQEDMKREVLRVNEPIKRGPISIIVQTIGVSPLFVVKGPSGQVLDRVYVSLNVMHGEEDNFQFETDKRFTFYVRFFPDYLVEDGIEKSKSIELKNPAMHLIVDREGRKVYEGTIQQGEYAGIEPYNISFEDLRYWAEFMIVREYGRIPLVAGFIFASIGLIMRLVFYQKRVRLAIEYEDSKLLLYIDGRSEFFRYSFKGEMDRLADELDVFLRSSKVS
jgi:hypothetical protein